MGVYSEDSLEANVVMFRLVFIVAVAAAAPLEDTTEVALAKAEFQAAFDAALAGEHAALAPVNNDVQAEQIPDEFLDDAADVAAARPSSSPPSSPPLLAVLLTSRPRPQFTRSPWPPLFPLLFQLRSTTLTITFFHPTLAMAMAMLAILSTATTATTVSPSSSSK